MAVSLDQWRVIIDNFNCQSSELSYHVCIVTQNFVSMLDVLLYCWHYFESAFIFLLTLVHIVIILQCHGDIEPNPGPRKLIFLSLSLESE